VKYRRGDVVLAWSPFSSGAGGKRRPCVVIQNDDDNRKLANTVVAEVTTMLSRVGDKSHILIEVGTPEGRQTGLIHDSVISCNNLATIDERLIQKLKGTLAAKTVHEMNDCLKAALELP
jgi:mRNA interferase MazF